VEQSKLVENDNSEAKHEDKQQEEQVRRGEQLCDSTESAGAIGPAPSDDKDDKEERGDEDDKHVEQLPDMPIHEPAEHVQDTDRQQPRRSVRVQRQRQERQQQRRSKSSEPRSKSTTTSDLCTTSTIPIQELPNINEQAGADKEFDKRPNPKPPYLSQPQHDFPRQHEDDLTSEEFSHQAASTMSVDEEMNMKELKAPDDMTDFEANDDERQATKRKKKSARTKRKKKTKLPEPMPNILPSSGVRAKR
jgi:hypothetical protein